MNPQWLALLFLLHPYTSVNYKIKISAHMKSHSISISYYFVVPFDQVYEVSFEHLY